MFNSLPPTGIPFSWKFIFSPGTHDKISLDDRLRSLAGGEPFVTCSGKSALYLILKSAFLKEPLCNEVIIPDYTCWSVPSALVKAGLKVRPVDIDKNNFGLSPESVESAINKKTLAVVMTHLFGIPGQIDIIEEICRRHNIILIDDAAQSLGASLNGRPLGSFGDAGLFSFGRGKNITTLNGGAALIRNDSLIKIAKGIYQNDFPVANNFDPIGDVVLAAYKILFSRYLYWLPNSLPFLKLGVTEYNPNFCTEKMPPRNRIRGAMMFEWLDNITRDRKEKASAYRKLFEKKGYKGISIFPENSNPVYLRFPLCLENSKNRRYILKKGRNFGISGMYPNTVSSIDGLKPYLASDIPQCSSATRVSETLITLPTHYCITTSDIRNIVDIIDKGNG